MSTESGPSVTGGGTSFLPVFGANGRYVVFLSQARNLATNDNLSGHLNVYVRDLIENRTSLISVNRDGVGGATGDSAAPSISPDGRFVAFESTGDDIAANDTNAVTDVFVRDLHAGTTVLASVDAIEAGIAVGAADNPSTTPDANYVAFTKRATNIISGAVSLAEIYVRDLAGGTTTWVSAGIATNYFGGATNGSSSFYPTISTNGRVVAFLAAERYSTHGRLFRRDLDSGALTLISDSVPVGYGPTMTGDGRWIAYPDQAGLHIWDSSFGTNLTVTLCGPGGVPFEAWASPAMTDDGRRVAFIGTQTNQAAVYVFDAQTACSRLVSVSTNGEARSPVIVSVPAISGDGTRVAFESLAADLVTNDRNQTGDVLVRQLPEEKTVLISERAALLPTRTGARRATLTANSVSANGRVMAYASLDNLLDASDANPWQDVFIRDVMAGTNLCVSAIASTGTSTGSFAAYPAISADGRYVAYQEDRDVIWVNLETRESKRFERISELDWTTAIFRGPNPYLSEVVLSSDGRYVAFSMEKQVYFRDMWSTNSSNVLVSANRVGFPSCCGQSFAPRFSPDAKWIAFLSSAFAIPTNQTVPYGMNIYVRNVSKGQTRLLTPNQNGPLSGSAPAAATFSGDSQYMFFHWRAVYPLESADTAVFRQELASSGTNEIVCRACRNPSPSADGRFVAVQTYSQYQQWTTVRFTNDVFVVDMQSGQSNLVSADLSGTRGGNGSSSSPLMSYDGRYVVFTSLANDLVAIDTNGVSDVFVRDLWNASTMLVSLNEYGTGSGNGASSTPVLSADGRNVFFQSHASDLAPGDYNQARDVFVLSLAGTDDDRDGMDDDWEMAYLDTISRDGNGDFDEDGQTDLQEFRAGTNPANNLSILRVLTVTPMSGGGKTLLWTAAPGRKYQVQFKASIEDVGWTDLPGVVTAAGTTGSKADDTEPGTTQRFYRVLLVQ